MDKIEKIKTLLNKKIERRPTFGTDPNEPWSVRAGITEGSGSLLDRYLNSRGINPKFLSKYTRISHAKSSAFQQWKRDHLVEDTEIDESKTLQHTPVELRQHAINKEKHMTKVLHHNGLHKEESEQIDELAPETLASYVLKTTSKDPKRAEPRKKAMSKLAKIMAKRSFSEAKTIQGTALDKFRQAAADRARKHDDIEREMKARHAAGKEDMKGSIDRLAKQLNKEETINEVSSSEVQHHFDKWTNSEHAPYNSDAGDDNKVHQSALRYLRSTDVPKENHEKLAMHIAHKFHGSGIDEEAEQIDEGIEVKKEYNDKTEAEHGVYHNGKKIGYIVHHKPSGTHTAYHSPQDDDDYGQIDDFDSHHDAVSQIRHSAGVGVHEEVEQIDEKNVPTSPEKWARAKAAAKSKFAVYPSAYANGWASKKYKAMGGGWKSVKEEIDLVEKNDSHTHAAHYEDPKTGEWTGMNLLIAKDDDDAVRQAHEKCKEGCRLTKVERHITVKEEVEQIDELKMSTVKSYHKKRLTDFSYTNKKPGETSTKQRNARIKKVSAGIDRSIDRQTGYKPTSESAGISKTKETKFHKKLDTLVHNTFGKRKDELKMKEDVFQDTQAATQTAFDMGTQADDREPTYSKKKEMSKSARMIKSLYKKHKMVKEELYDHEKEDKSVASYGKKPKVEKQEVYDDDQAAMVLSGGKTLTGQTRDTLEIDPVLRKPVKPDNKQQINKQQ
jgi:hypothetical protein